MVRGSLPGEVLTGLRDIRLSGKRIYLGFKLLLHLLDFLPRLTDSVLLVNDDCHHYKNRYADRAKHQSHPRHRFACTARGVITPSIFAANFP